MSMYPTYSASVHSAYPALNASRETSALEVASLVNRPSAFSRHVVEVLFYLTTINSMLMPLTGWGYQIRFAGAAPTIVSGMLALVILLLRREPLPKVLWFAAAINIGATFSEMVVSGARPFLSPSLSQLTIWFCVLTMACYIVENDAARKRMMVVLSLMVFCFVWLGGISLFGYSTIKRLDFSALGSSTFGDANALAYYVGGFAISFLFWSLRSSKLIRPLLWVLAALLVLVLLRTVSRGGIAAFTCAAMVLLVAILMGRGVRLSGIVLVLVGFVAAVVLASAAATSIDFLQQRMMDPASDVRVQVYSVRTLRQMASTIVLGNGPSYARTAAAGINAHNAFINTHLTYGGITAYPYLLMLLFLMWRLKRLVFSPELPLDVRLWPVAFFGIAFTSQMMTNLGYTELQSVIALALVDRFTAPYARRAVSARRSARAQFPVDPHFAHGLMGAVR